VWSAGFQKKPYALIFVFHFLFLVCRMN
jgi:hypothetical protein